jgi:DNA polymerase epsilon subunit 2
LFLLFGMLSRNPEGKLCLEDGEGRVPLDMEDAVSLVNSAEEDAEAGVDRSWWKVPGEGMFTEGCMVLIEGEYTIEETVRVLAMGHPPSEKRDIARWVITPARELDLTVDRYMVTSIFWVQGQYH